MDFPPLKLPIPTAAPRDFKPTSNGHNQAPDTETSKPLSTIFSEIKKKTNSPGSTHRRVASGSYSTKNEISVAPNSWLPQAGTSKLTLDQTHRDDDDDDDLIVEISGSEEELDDRLMDCMTKAEMIASLIEEDSELELAYKEWKKIEQTETGNTKASRFKVPANLAVGALSQISSFAVAAYLGQPPNHWLIFPITATLLNELFSTKALQIFRVTNFSTPDMKILYDQQRYFGRAVGDLLRHCAGMPIKKKYLLERNGEKEKVTAWEMVNGKEYFGAAHRNFLVRGLPFIWFTVLYEGRDAILRFDPSAPVLTTLSVGLLAGALTLQTGQLIAARTPGAEEKPNFSTRYFQAKTAFEKKLLEAMPNFITKLDDEFADEFNVNVNKAKDLQKSLERDVAYGTMKSSVFLSYPAEVGQSFRKRREASSIEPEFSGSRTDTLMNLGGIFCSLILYSYLADIYSTYAIGHKNNPNAPYDPLIEATKNFILPIALIFLAGYAFRDNMRIIPRVGLGLTKGAFDVVGTKIRAACSAVRQCYRPGEAELSNDTTTTLPTFFSSTSLNAALDHVETRDKPPKLRRARPDINPDGAPVENLIEDPDSDAPKLRRARPDINPDGTPVDNSIEDPDSDASSSVV